MFGWFKSKNNKSTLEQKGAGASPIIKTKADLDFELMSSIEWKNHLIEADNVWNNRFNELDDLIIELQKSEMKMILYVCAEFFNISVELNDALFDDSYRVKIISKIKEILSLDAYKEHMTKKKAQYYNSYIRTIDYYASEFIILRNQYLLGSLNLYKNYLNNAEIVLNDIHELERTYKAFSPETNHAGRNAWRKYMETYAFEKLQGLTIADFYPINNPLYNKNYFEYNIKNLPHSISLFAMQIYAATLFFEQKLDSSTSAVGIEFENKLRETLITEISDVIVETTPVSGDQGADLLVKVGSVRIAIQAKRYTGVVGNAAVQEIFAAKQFYDADFAMVVTTSHFTNPAQVLAHKLEVTLATESDFVQKIRRLLD